MLLSQNFSTLNDNIIRPGIHDLLMHMPVMKFFSKNTCPLPDEDQATS